jgi:archaellum component FlaG (FlaF/FlaG flagellin family)
LQTRSVLALIALAATGIILTFATSALLSTSQYVPVDGTVSSINVGVYTDSACTVNCTSISTGAVSPGATKTYMVYVKNTGSIPMNLTMTTSGWNPAAADGPITLTWNRENYSLAPGASVSATLTLTVSDSISTSITGFTFDVAITGTA